MPNAIKGLGDIERDHSALTTGLQSRGPDMESISKKITSRPGSSRAILMIREKIVCLKESKKLISDDGLHCFGDE